MGALQDDDLLGLHLVRDGPVFNPLRRVAALGTPAAVAVRVGQE
jgi:hypothetical protein